MKLCVRGTGILFPSSTQYLHVIISYKRVLEFSVVLGSDGTIVYLAVHKRCKLPSLPFSSFSARSASCVGSPPASCAPSHNSPWFPWPPGGADPCRPGPPLGWAARRTPVRWRRTASGSPWCSGGGCGAVLEIPVCVNKQRIYIITVKRAFKNLSPIHEVLWCNGVNAQLSPWEPWFNSHYHPLLLSFSKTLNSHGCSWPKCINKDLVECEQYCGLVGMCTPVK